MIFEMQERFMKNLEFTVKFFNLDIKVFST